MFFLRVLPALSSTSKIDSSPNGVRTRSTDSQRIHRTNLSPEDAVTLSKRRYSRTSGSLAVEDPQWKVKGEARRSTRTSRSLKYVDPATSQSSPSTSKPSHCRRCHHCLPASSTSSTLPSKSKTAPRPKARASECKQLPPQVQDCILEQLQGLHSQRSCTSCSTCLMRDLVSLQRVNRSWEKAARLKLYERTVIMGTDSPAQLKKYKTKNGSRLRLLRRTLRERPWLANLVKELDVSDPGIPPYLQNGTANPEYVEYRDLVASVIMLCPNLERLRGFYTIYNHDYDRLTHALSMREKLKEQVWIIGDNEAVSERARSQLPPGLLDKHQVYQFLHYHHLWSQLERLMMCSPGQSGVIEQEVFTQIFQLLPSLKHLCVSSFDADDFTDQVLLALPPLISLRVEECRGISDLGLARFVARPAAVSLQNLTLVHQNVHALLVISKILASLPSLLKFTIVQSDVVPSLSNGEVVFQPILASASLRHLHWDISRSRDARSSKVGFSSNLGPRSSEGPISLRTPNTHLALSILHSGFPSLVSLRAPQDISPPGALQAVCRPTKDAKILLPADRCKLPALSRPPEAPMPRLLPLSNSLHAARVRAQSYIDSTLKSKKEFVRVVVTDHSGYETTNNAKESGSFSQHSRSSLQYSRASTTRVDLGDLCPPTDEDTNNVTGTEPLVSCFSQNDSPSTSNGSTRTSSTLCSFSSATLLQNAYSLAATPRPVKVQEFSFPMFVGRVASWSATSKAPPPMFHLLPDLAGCDAEGGLIGWADLWKIREMDSAAVQNSTVGNGCSGMWNQMHPKGPDWWKHTEREKAADPVPRLQDFF